MTSPDETPTNPRDFESGQSVEACVRGLERLLSIAGKPVDRPQIRRTVGEAMRAWPGAIEQQWWVWLVESGVSLGISLRPIDLSPRELQRLVLHGDAVLLGPSDEHPWRLLQRSGSRVHIESCPDGLESRSTSLGSLVTSLGLSQADELRCVVLEPQMQDISAISDHQRPWNRLARLIRPEWTEIWMLVVFSVFVGVLNLATPIAVEALVNTVAFGRFLQPVVVLALMLFVFLAFAASLRALQTVVAEVIQRRLFVRVARDLGRRLPRVQQEAYDEEYGPELVNRFFDVITIQKVVPTLLLDGLTVILSTAIGMAVLAFYHPWLLGFDAVLLVLMAVATFGLGRGAIKSSIIESKKKYKVAAWLEELARCPTAFRLEGGPEFASDRTDQLVANYLEARRGHFRILMRQVVFSLGLQAIASTALLGIGGWLVISGQLTLGQLVAAELIVAVIVGAFAKLGKHLESVYDLMASVDKLGHLADLPLERDSGLLHHPHTGPASLKMDGISYQHAGHGGIQRLSLQLNSGEKVLLHGSSGTGKSTLADLLFGLRQPDSGTIAIDQVSPREYRPDILRGHVALARSGDLFEGTILENVHLERTAISPQDAREALVAVGLLDELSELEEGLETHLPASGSPLSDGQIRRLILARAIAGKPRLLVLDGLLDSLSPAEANRCLLPLADRQAPWTLVVLSSRADLQAEWDQVISLQETHS
ncbi:MAG: ABC transporter ATP-binding protein [Planctomycetales bacterium]|nr:ABC transporter ATP-binding protein [Planctomycetales bacterium]